MAGDEGDIIAQREELFADAGNQRVKVAARKIGAPDGAGKEHVADLRKTRFFVIKGHVPGRVAGRVQHTQGFFAHLHAVAIGQPALRRTGFHAADAEHLRLLHHAVEPEGVFFVRAFNGNVAAQLPDEVGGTAGVIQMAVGEQDALDGELERLGRGNDLGGVATGVDDCRAARFLAPNERAVLAEGCDGNNVPADHGVPPGERSRETVIVM